VEQSVHDIRESETRLEMTGHRIYIDFGRRARVNAGQVRNYVQGHGRGMIYGAGTRGATLFQYAHTRVDAAVDNNPGKHGRYYLDTGIPIISAEEAMKDPPDYFLLLPYHLADEIVKREQASFPRTRWIIPLPSMKIV
jgi:C-methyltransferase